jgi:hypothetical protein
MTLDPRKRGSSQVLLLVFAWLVVGIPAAWGVTQTVKQSLNLFRAPPANPTPATRPTALHGIPFTAHASQAHRG